MSRLALANKKKWITLCAAEFAQLHLSSVNTHKIPTKPHRKHTDQRNEKLRNSTPNVATHQEQWPIVLSRKYKGSLKSMEKVEDHIYS